MQISEELFIALLKYHLVERDDVLSEIKKGLEEKLEAMVRRDLYTKYKTAPTEEEKRKGTTGVSGKGGNAPELPMVNFFPSVCRTGACHAPVYGS